MEFLHANTKSLLDSGLQDGKYISAAGKKVRLRACVCVRVNCALVGDAGLGWGGHHRVAGRSIWTRRAGRALYASESYGFAGGNGAACMAGDTSINKAKFFSFYDGFLIHWFSVKTDFSLFTKFFTKVKTIPRAAFHDRR